MRRDIVVSLEQIVEQFEELVFDILQISSSLVNNAFGRAHLVRDLDQLAKLAR